MLLQGERDQGLGLPTLSATTDYLAEAYKELTKVRIGAIASSAIEFEAVTEMNEA